MNAISQHIALLYTTPHFTPLYLPHSPPLPSTSHHTHITLHPPRSHPSPLPPCQIIPHCTLSHTPHSVHPVAGVSMDTGSTGAYLSPGSLSSKVGRKPGHRERILAYSTVGYGIICCIFVIFSELIIQFFSIFYFLCYIFIFLIFFVLMLISSVLNNSILYAFYMYRILEHPTTSLLKF